MNNNITITCRLHGNFEVRAANHTHPIMGSTEDQKYYSGCQKCSKSWRFKKPDKKKLKAQLLKESSYNLKRHDLTMDEVPGIKLLLNELITTGLFMVNHNDTKGSGGIRFNLISKCSSKLTAVAIDVVTEKKTINKQFLETVAEITLKHIAYMATKFEYTGTNASDQTNRLDKIKRPAWQLVDACQGRLDNGNKQLRETRKSASEFLRD